MPPEASDSQTELPGYSLRCPMCHRVVLPEDGLLHLLLAPRLAFHLWDEHPYEAAILRLHLERPPDAWPVAS
jgi:hypothetical protein